MDSIGISILIIFILIIANGIFAMTEIAIVTSKKNRLESLKNQGNSRAGYALLLAENPNQLLSTIQIGITLIGIVTGAFGGATIAGQLAVYVEKIDILAPYSYEISMVLIVALTTFFALVIGELVPKRIGMGNPERIACIVAKPMYYFSQIGRPLVWLLSKSTELTLKLLRVKPRNEPEVTEEEIAQLIELGVYSGVVEPIESDIVEQVFDLGDKRLGDILTPRTQLVWIDLEDSFETNIAKMNNSLHSKFPVGKGSLDNFKGVIHTKTVLAKMASGKKFTLEECVDDTLVLPETMKVFHALEALKKAGQHEAIVIDEYGGLEGFVTLHDFMENIVGDLPEKEDDSDPQIVEREEGSWLADGLVTIDHFIKYFDLEEGLIKSTKHMHTLGGFIISQIGDIPKVNDKVQVGNLVLEVVDMDQFRVDKVMITRIDEPVEEVKDIAK